MPNDERRLAGLFYEMGLLKRYPRTGWLVAGVKDPESIAEHSFRVAVIASTLAVLEGADPDRAALLAIFHDSQETRLTDVPYLAKPYVTRAPNEEVTADQTRGLPDTVAELINGRVAEYERQDTPEGRCARDADKLECLIQAIEYREQGHAGIQPWIDSSLAALRTTSAKRLAEEALGTNPLDWLDRFFNGEGPPGA